MKMSGKGFNLGKIVILYKWYKWKKILFFDVFFKFSSVIKVLRILW